MLIGDLPGREPQNLLRASKAFFSEEKKQKTFYPLAIDFLESP